MKRREIFYCELEDFSGRRGYYTVTEWLDFCKEYGPTNTELDSSGRKVLYKKIKNKKNKKIIVNSHILLYLTVLFAVLSVVILFELFVCSYSQAYNCFYIGEYQHLAAIFLPIATYIMYYLNNSENFTYVNGMFGPGIKKYNGYYLSPIIYVTFFDILGKSDSLKVEDDFYKFRKQFYDYLNR